ncbi:MAG: hypothetical protein N2380_06640 [bacterium]|nr:hypothetical protein [bacterium]
MSKIARHLDFYKTKLKPISPEVVTPKRDIKKLFLKVFGAGISFLPPDTKSTVKEGYYGENTNKE